MKQALFVILLLFSAVLPAQNNCSFSKDTLFIPKEGKVVNGEYLQASLKNKSVIQFFITEGNRYYMKLTVSENLYFDRVDMLEIKSGGKSFYAKETKQYQLDKHTGFYVVELFKNYLATLKDDGITAIVFNKTETKYSKQDRAAIKQMSQCFYDVISNKK
jgi:hypothetical protein